MSGDRERYPARAEYGSPTQVCEWCGKRVQLSRAWREFGTYCSLECQAADRPSYYLGQFVFAFLAFILSISTLIFGYPLFPWFPFLIGSGFWLIYSGSMINLGSNVRKSSQSFS
jgi:hypothetical protein